MSGCANQRTLVHREWRYEGEVGTVYQYSIVVAVKEWINSAMIQHITRQILVRIVRWNEG